MNKLILALVVIAVLLSSGIAGTNTGAAQISTQLATGTGWYRDEYGRLFSVAESRENVILMAFRWGNYPARILAAEQEALGISDLALRALGYTATENGDWQQ